jgi:curli production assembly/transport component CsgF
MEFAKLLMRFMQVLCLSAAWMGSCVWADQLVYVPTNPTFGGNPLNAAGLQANAAAQNQFKAPVVPADTPLERFQSQLQSAILSRISSNVLSDLFDSKTIDFTKPKTYIAGDYVITIQQNPDKTVTMTTSDKNVPGSATTINLGNIANSSSSTP